MSGITIKPNLEDVREAVSYFEFVGGNTTQAVRVAINKTIPIAKTKIAKGITDRVNLKSTYVKSKIDFVKASRSGLNGRVYANSRGLLLSKYEYGAKTSLLTGLVTPDSPIRVKVKKGSGQIKTVTGDKDTYGKPFLFRLKGGGGDDGIDYGIGGWRKSPGPKGGRIKAFLAPSVSQEFDESRDKVLPAIADDYQNAMLNAMNYLLQKKYPVE